jgi:acyl-CoA dehydrogenase
MSWDFSTEPEFARELEWMETFVRENVWPLETLADELEWDQLVELMAPLHEEVKARNLWATYLDPELGGQGYGQVKNALVNEVLGSSPLAPAVFGNQAPDSGNAEIIAIAGSAEQRERYMQPLLDVTSKSAFSMTEPETPGSDPTQLRTRAIRDGDGWVLDGHKWFSSNASIADFLIVMAVTDPEAPPHRRASMFIVDADTPGVDIVRDVATMEHPAESWAKYGNHAEVYYRQVRLPADALLGGEGEGFAIAQKRLYPGRIHHAMRWLGVSRRAFDMLCERALSRSTHGTPLAEKQTIQNWIADSAAEMEAARLMTLRAAWKMDVEGVHSARREISLIKFFGARVLHDVIDRAIQIHGSLGYSTDLPLESMYRTARAARLVDGPDEVHRESVAKQILKEHKAASGTYPTEHLPTRREAARERFAAMLDQATAND